MAKRKMHPNSLKNLVDFSQRTKEEGDALRRKGIEVRRQNAEKRRTFKEIADILLKANYKYGKTINIESIESLAELKDVNMSADEKIVLEQILKAMTGDTAASKFIADLNGELKNKVEVMNDKPFEVNIKVVE